MKTVSKDLAIKLKEAGYPQEPMSAYWYIDKKGSGEWAYSVNYFPSKIPDFSEWGEGEFCAAPLAEEVLDELPRWCIIKNVRHELLIKRSGVDEFPYWIGYRELDHGAGFEMTGENLANAASKMWLYLKKEILI